ncbi:hypothetical protein G5I_13542 [Acromyrmex echinatior]|uniref:Uncharacterized protein n=1 Tax=Acromyrmex echinatior TaxID=103372 RepID=F4X5B4_ACREC|nr:hypothetical protein G5I_13542 [Acromyrmex echinatior]
MYQNQARGCFMDGNARKYALLVLLLDYGTAETPEKLCLDTLEYMCVQVKVKRKQIEDLFQTDTVFVDLATRRTAGCSRTQAGRVNAGSKVLVRTEFPTLDAGYEA